MCGGSSCNADWTNLPDAKVTFYANNGCIDGFKAVVIQQSLTMLVNLIACIGLQTNV